MIILERIGNDYFLNGKKGDYFNFNFDGKYKQQSYIMYQDKKGRWVAKWTFYGNLK